MCVWQECTRWKSQEGRLGPDRVYCWKARAAFVCVCPMPRLLVPFGFGDLWPAKVSWHVCVSALLRGGKYTRALLGAVAGMRLVGETKSEGLKSSPESDLCVFSNSELLLVPASNSVMVPFFLEMTFQ